jgi:hypothetical protein
MSGILLHSMLTLSITTTIPLDALWWLMPLVGILVYSLEGLFD